MQRPPTLPPTTFPPPSHHLPPSPPSAGERIIDITEDEISRLQWEGGAYPPHALAPGVVHASLLSGPNRMKVKDRLRVWWHEGRSYDGEVVEVSRLLGADCKPTLTFRVHYDDGDELRHVLGDFPIEALPRGPRPKSSGGGGGAGLPHSPKKSRPRDPSPQKARKRKR